MQGVCGSIHKLCVRVVVVVLPYARGIQCDVSNCWLMCVVCALPCIVLLLSSRGYGEGVVVVQLCVWWFEICSM